MTGEKTLSVLIPTYNYADFIDGAVASVLEQGVDDVEIVVADDGSTDHTAQVLAPRIEAGQVRYVRQENQGPSAARNLAMATARGRYLMFLDADDCLMPGCIAATMEFLDAHPEVGLFFTNYDIFDDHQVVTASGVDIWNVFRQIPRREVGPDAWVFTERLTSYIIEYGAFMHTSGLTVRRDIAQTAGPFRDGFFYAEDDEFYARVAYLADAGYVDRVLSRKRNHAGSLIHDDANALRNAEHILALTEIQLEHYRDDAKLQAILHRKAKARAAAVGWRLIQAGRPGEALQKMRGYLARYPLYGPFYRLSLKAALFAARRRS